MARTRQSGGDRFTLEVPLDVSGIEDAEPGQKVKVLAQDRSGALYSDTVSIGPKQEAVATLAFDEHPGALRVMVGPADAEDEELRGLQTIALDVPPRLW